MHLVHFFRAFILSVLLVGVTPALCWKNPFSDGQEEFQRLRQRFDPIYETFWDRCPGVDHELDKKLRILSQYQDKEWVKKNILRVVRGQFNKDLKVLITNLSASKFRDIMRTRNELREGNYKQKMNELMRNYRLYHDLNTAPHNFRLMYQRLGEITPLVEDLGRIIEALDRWTVKPTDGVQHTPEGGLPMDLKDYLRALLEERPRDNKYWQDMIVGMDRWHQLYYIHSNGCWFWNRGPMNMDRLYQCAANPLWFHGRVFVTILKDFLLDDAMTAGLNHDGVEGEIRWSNFRRLYEREPEIWVPRYMSDNPKHKMQVRQEVAKIKMLVRGVGKNRGFGMSDLMLKGLTDAKAWNEVAKKRSMAKRPPPPAPKKIGFGQKLKNFFGFKSGEKQEAKEVQGTKKETQEIKEVKDVKPKENFRVQEEEKNEGDEIKVIEHMKPEHFKPQKIAPDDNDEKNEGKEENDIEGKQ